MAFNKLRVDGVSTNAGPYSDPDLSLLQVCQSTCHFLDLERHNARVTYKGPISRGALFAWNPHNPHACEVIEVVESNHDIVTIRARQRCQGTFTIPIDRFREAAVLSRFKGLPDRQGQL